MKPNVNGESDTAQGQPVACSLMATGTAAYATLVGLSVGLALFFLTLAFRRGRVLSFELLVGLYSLVAAGQTLSTLRLHSSSTTEEYAEILHGSFTYLGIATLIAATWIVGQRTQLWFPRVPLALAGVGLIAIALNALTPGALIADEIRGLRNVSLFGEAFVVHTPSPGSLQPLLFGFLVAITAYIVSALVIGVRRRTGRLDVVIAGISVAWLINLYDTLVDEAIVDTSYLAPFGLVVLVGGLAVEHANGLIATERQLTKQSTELESVVAARTAALRAAHEDLVRQLDQQNESALRLAELSELFLLLSSVSAADDDVVDVLGEALALLGEIVDATDVQIRWQPEGMTDDETTKVVEWNKPATESSTGRERATIERTLRSGTRVVGRLIIIHEHGRRFPNEYRRLADLTAQYLGGLLARLQLESSRVNLAVDDERRRIARELHDSLSQRLYAAAFNAEAISLTAAVDSDSAARKAAEIRTLVLSTLAEMRTLVFDLQPEVLGKQSLGDLVAQLCTSSAEIYQRPVGLVVVDDQHGIPTTPKLALYRIVQESLSNALRHSDATRVDVTIDVNEKQVTVTLVDDGLGFDPSSTRTGHGLRNIRQRASEIGATLNLTSRHGAGTTVMVTWANRGRNLPVEAIAVPDFEVAE